MSLLPPIQTRPAAPTAPTRAVAVEPVGPGAGIAIVPRPVVPVAVAMVELVVMPKMAMLGVVVSMVMLLRRSIMEVVVEIRLMLAVNREVLAVALCKLVLRD